MKRRLWGCHGQACAGRPRARGPESRGRRRRCCRITRVFAIARRQKDEKQNRHVAIVCTGGEIARAGEIDRQRKRESHTDPNGAASPGAGGESKK